MIAAPENNIFAMSEPEFDAWTAGERAKITAGWLEKAVAWRNASQAYGLDVAQRRTFRRFMRENAFIWKKRRALA